MKIRIVASSKNQGSIVNKIGKYLNSHIDGAYKITFHTMECEVTMMMYYQIPGDPDSLDRMDFNINITSYQNKVRINLTETDEFEKTIGQIILSEDETHDLPLVQKKVLTQLKRSIAREYEEYDFVY